MRNKKKVNKISPIVQTLLEAYLRQDNVKIEFHSVPLKVYRSFPEYIATMEVKENDKNVLTIELMEKDLQLEKNDVCKFLLQKGCRIAPDKFALYVTC